MRKNQQVKQRSEYWRTNGLKTHFPKPEAFLEKERTKT
jgi:hypothetical protein